ncbi:hypothetical protein CL614_08220 [archaeon]|nr:hypothetical protein [archaeon]|tara:strand:- start:1091 stop:1549 length:459 start_codon:yes stop_codon:yes gene_type:complete
MSAKYDISLFQGETLNLHLLYLDENDNAITVPDNTYSSRLQVRRSSDATSILLDVNSSPYGVTAGITGGGGTGGEFGYTGATAYASTTGGIKLNRNMGDTGGQTGGILIFAGATAMGHVPIGRHLYDLQLGVSGETTQLIHGRFECYGEITR